METTVDLRLQLYAVVVADELNFSAAANRLHVAQPALSRSIRQLENQLGITLFRRTSRKVEITEEGLRFIYEARKAVHYASRAVAATKKPKSKTKIIIGYPPQFDVRFMMDLNNIKLAALPGLQVVTQGSFTTEILANIQKKKFDAGIVLMPREYPEIANLPTVKLHSFPLLVALRKSHPLAKRRALHLSDIKEQPLITPKKEKNPPLYDWFENRCQAAGFRPNIAHQTMDPHEYGTLIYHGKGIGMAAGLSSTCPVHKLPDNVVLRPFHEPDLVVETALVFGEEFSSGPLRQFLLAAEHCWQKYKPKKSHLPISA